MAPQSRKEELDAIDFDTLKSKKAAVLCLVYPKNNKTHIVFMLRNTYPGVHSQQISFPGGKKEDNDKSFFATALRETEEEIGVSKAQVQLIHPLSQLYIPPSNFLVYPYFGFTNIEPTFQPEPAEVAEIIEIELSHILNEKCISRQNINTAYAKKIEVNCFKYQQHIIWGATAMILSEVRSIIHQVDMD